MFIPTLILASHLLIHDYRQVQFYSDCQPNKLIEQDLAFADSIIKGHRRGDYNGHTADDIYWLYQCVEAEQGINNHRAKYLTACCIINRAKYNWGGSTLTDVIFAKNQFEVVSNNRIYKVYPSEDTILACNEALDNVEDWVVYFSMGNLHKKWATLVEVHNGEYFYKNK